MLWLFGQVIPVNANLLEPLISIKFRDAGLIDVGHHTFVSVAFLRADNAAAKGGLRERKKIVLQERSEVGLNVTVDGGAHLEPEAHVGHGAHIPAGGQVKEQQVYWGHPRPIISMSLPMKPIERGSSTCITTLISLMCLLCHRYLMIAIVWAWILIPPFEVALAVMQLRGDADAYVTLGILAASLPILLLLCQATYVIALSRFLQLFIHINRRSIQITQVAAMATYEAYCCFASFSWLVGGQFGLLKLLHGTLVFKLFHRACGVRIDGLMDTETLINSTGIREPSLLHIGRGAVIDQGRVTSHLLDFGVLKFKPTFVGELPARACHIPHHAISNGSFLVPSPCRWDASSRHGVHERARERGSDLRRKFNACGIIQ